MYPPPRVIDVEMGMGKAITTICELPNPVKRFADRRIVCVRERGYDRRPVGPGASAYSGSNGSVLETGNRQKPGRLVCVGEIDN